jgi:FdhD protein
MGHMVAQKVNMTLLARCTGKHFLLVTGKERLIYEPELLTGTEQSSSHRQLAV